MDTPPKKRRFWQLHLSTAIFLMVGAGLVGWLNASKRFTELSPVSVDKDFTEGVIERGWPFAFYSKYVTLIKGETLEHLREAKPGNPVEDMVIVEGKGVAVPTEWVAQVQDDKPTISQSNGLLDCGIGILFLFCIVAISEMVIWRRDALSENMVRPWYRLHILTLLLIALTLGGLLALNLIGPSLDFRAPKASPDSGFQQEVYGWPYRAYVINWFFDCLDRFWVKSDNYNDTKATVIDVVLLISIPAVIALASEWLIRRPKLKAMRLRLRWNLDTQLMMVILLGTMMYVWHTRSPWALISSEVVNGPLNDLFYTKLEMGNDGVASSQDRTRAVLIDFKHVNVWSLDPNPKARRYEIATKDLLCQLTPAFIPYRAGFVDDDTVIVIDEPPDRDDGPIQVVTYRRRFNELTAWGHLHRPEVWALIAVTAIFLWRISLVLRRREARKP